MVIEMCGCGMVLNCKIGECDDRKEPKQHDDDEFFVQKHDKKRTGHKSRKG